MRNPEASSRMRRPAAIALLASNLVVVLSIGCGSASAAPARRELVIVATGGVSERLLREHFYDPFMQATRVTVRPVAAGFAEQ